MTGYSTGTGNQLTNDGTWTYTYDANGNEATKTNTSTGDSWSYGYDNKNHLVSAIEKDVNTNVEVEVDYKYDALDNRVKRDVDTDGDGIFDQTQKYAFDGWNPAKSNPIGNENFQVWGELDSTGSLTTQYVPGDAVDEVFARIAADGSAYWLLGDHLGSIREVLDNTGAVKDDIRYDGYGNIISESHPDYGGTLKYTSRPMDEYTGLQHNGRREYDPKTGTWNSPDPDGFRAGDSNLYRYVNNQPTTMMDPSGLAPPDCPRYPYLYRPFGEIPEGAEEQYREDLRRYEQEFEKYSKEVDIYERSRMYVDLTKLFPIPNKQYGKFRLINQRNQNGTRQNGLTAGSAVKIQFIVNTKEVIATSIAFVQIVRILNSKGENADNNKRRIPRLTKDNWVIDRQPMYDSGWYGYDKNGFVTNRVAPWRDGLYSADMIDTPHWKGGLAAGTRWEYELFAIAKTGKDAGKVYGGFTWGFTVDSRLKVTSLPNKVLPGVTPEFKEAVEKWDAQAKMRDPAMRNSLGQQPFSHNFR